MWQGELCSGCTTGHHRRHTAADSLTKSPAAHRHRTLLHIQMWGPTLRLFTLYLGFLTRIYFHCSAVGLQQCGAELGLVPTPSK